MRCSLKYLAIAGLCLIATTQKVAADEPSSLSDRLAYNVNIDPTTVFLNIADTDDGERQQMVGDLLDFAEKYLGHPYCRGSKGPKSFDCSGFTSFVFKNFGIQLSASSSAQYGQGQKIQDNEIEPGDLLFFGGRAGSKSRVGHVAIAVDVDEDGVVTFIHAATSGGIRYDQYPDGGYYSKRYIGARRVIE